MAEIRRMVQAIWPVTSLRIIVINRANFTLGPAGTDIVHIDVMGTPTLILGSLQAANDLLEIRGVYNFWYSDAELE